MSDSQTNPTPAAEGEGTAGSALDYAGMTFAVELTVQFPENGDHPVYFLA